MRYYVFLFILLFLSGCSKNSHKNFEKDGEFSLKAEVFTIHEAKQMGILLLKDWKDRIISAFEVNLSCVTPGLASMPNPMPSIGSYEKSDGSRCYVYIKRFLSNADLDLNEFKTTESYSVAMKEILSEEE